MAIVVNAGLHSTYSDGAEVQNRYRLVLELEPYASPVRLSPEYLSFGAPGDRQCSIHVQLFGRQFAQD